MRILTLETDWLFFLSMISPKLFFLLQRLYRFYRALAALEFSQRSQTAPSCANYVRVLAHGI